jgi:transcriptional regulator with PAS, ATPase and Fis domain
VGSNTPVRKSAASGATNVPRAGGEGRRFREDLYFRMNVIVIHIPR